jgi:hypothetical protein
MISDRKSDTLWRMDGVLESSEQRVIIKRTQFKSLQDDARTLLPETAYTEIGESNVTRRFEEELRKLIGTIPQSFLTPKSWKGSVRRNSS